MEKISTLAWDEKYSVQVKEIDDQHKTMFGIINSLISLLHTSPTNEDVSQIVSKLIAYKKNHFETEERYFKQFSYEGTQEHIDAHNYFSSYVEDLAKKNSSDPLGLAFQLVDFLEDWLIDHILIMDHKYIECFKSHNLK